MDKWVSEDELVTILALNKKESYQKQKENIEAKNMIE